jgi:hypothetical protein
MQGGEEVLRTLGKRKGDHEGQGATDGDGWLLLKEGTTGSRGEEGVRHGSATRRGKWGRGPALHGCLPIRTREARWAASS